MVLTVGNKPRYVASQPSTFMKDVEKEIAKNKAKNMKNEAEMEEALNELDKENKEEE